MTEVWRAPAVERVRPNRLAGEREQLEAWVDWHRATLMRKCAGLTAEQLKQRAVPPSNLSLLGLVRHMTECERWWFRIHALDQELPYPYSADADDEADFDDIENADAAANLEAFWREVDEAKKAAATRQLDDVVPAHHPDVLDWTYSIRWIYLHMIEEYARHNGHADLLRECIDGATGQ